MHINLTGHQVHELISDTVFEPSALTIRAHTKSTLERIVDGISHISSDEHFLSHELPEPHKGVYYIVSALTMNAIPPDRLDFVCPKEVVRNSNGDVIGCKAFRCRSIKSAV